MLIMIGQNNLDPQAVILGSFILIVLFLAGLIETAIQLFGTVSLRSLLVFHSFRTHIYISRTAPNNLLID